MSKTKTKRTLAQALGITPPVDDRAASVEMNARELATVLAALRMWQDRNQPGGVHPRKVLDLEQVIAREHGPELDAEEIDALCERLNLGTGAKAANQPRVTS